MRKKLLIALICVFAAAFLVCGFFLVQYFVESAQSKQVYDDLAGLVELARPTAPPTAAPDPEAPTEAPTEPPSPYVEVTDPKTGAQRTVLREYAEVYTRNPDLVGWLRIDDTVINYPVMQTPDRPNYYIDHDFYGNYSAHGCLYAKENSNIDSSCNVTIYGHNMRDGSMLAALYNYGYYAYWQSHRYITFDTLTEHHTYEIFAVFITTASEGQGFAYHTFVDGDIGEFNWFVDNCRALRFYDTGVSTQYGDQFITLSTCEYSQVNGRLVVVAKLVN